MMHSGSRVAAAVVHAAKKRLIDETVAGSCRSSEVVEVSEVLARPAFCRSHRSKTLWYASNGEA